MNDQAEEGFLLEVTITTEIYKSSLLKIFLSRENKSNRNFDNNTNTTCEITLLIYNEMEIMTGVTTA